MSNLLVIDWDTFFVNPMENGEDRIESLLYDWGHFESRLHVEGLWSARVTGFSQAGLPLPRVTEPEGGWAAYWDRFTFVDFPNLAVCDSNAYAGLERPDPSDPSRGFEQVWLFDAHHDCGYGKHTLEQITSNNEFSCEDWMGQHYALGSQLHVRYPKWKTNAFAVESEAVVPAVRAFDSGSPVEVPFTHVLLCRSGAWVPSWCDDQFEEFVSAYPGDSTWIDQTFETPRAFTLAAAQAHAAELDEIIAKMRAGALGG